jgi:cell division protease FtsH
MTTVQNMPDQPFLNQDWDQEETLVDNRNRLGNRFRRFIRSGWWWKITLAIFILGMFIPQIMVVLALVLSVGLRIGLTLMIVVIEFVAIFWFMSRSRMYTIMPGAEGVGFADYRGQPELLEQAKQIVTLLRGVKAFEGSGGEPLNGLLLEGPPGTGKTWLAQAISTEAGVPFYYVDTSSLQGMFVGTSSLKVNRVYARARKAAKQYGAAVVFMDEIDSVGARGGVSAVGGNGGGGGMGGMFGGMGGGMGLLSTLLVQMDGFGQEHGWRARLRSWYYKTFLKRNPPSIPKRVLTIGATNRIAALDPALLRPGRFDKKIRVDAPDMEGRRDIFEYYLTKFAHDDTMVPAILATETPGYTPADIKYLLNESLRYALFDGRRYITYRDFRLAQPEHEMGLRAPLKHISAEARRRLAYSKAGQAVAVRLFEPHCRIARVSITRQGSAFGHVWYYSAREDFEELKPKSAMLNHLKTTIAAKAAEIEFCGLENQTSGMERDLQRVHNELFRMTSAGMFGAMGANMQMGLNPLTGTVEWRLTPDQAAAIDEIYQQLLNETREALRAHAHIVNALVEKLLEKEEILADEIREFFDEYGLYTPEPTVIRDGEEISLLTETAVSQPPSRIAASTNSGRPNGRASKRETAKSQADESVGTD